MLPATRLKAGDGQTRDETTEGQDLQAGRLGDANRFPAVGDRLPKPLTTSAGTWLTASRMPSGSFEPHSGGAEEIIGLRGASGARPAGHMAMPACAGDPSTSDGKIGTFEALSRERPRSRLCPPGDAVRSDDALAANGDVPTACGQPPDRTGHPRRRKAEGSRARAWQPTPPCGSRCR